MSFVSFAVGALIGAGAGYVTSVLNAPQEGEKTRRDIKQAASEIAINAVDVTSETLDNVALKLNQVSDNIYENMQENVQVSGEAAQGQASRQERTETIEDVEANLGEDEIIIEETLIDPETGQVSGTSIVKEAEKEF